MTPKLYITRMFSHSFGHDWPSFIVIYNNEQQHANNLSLVQAKELAKKLSKLTHHDICFYDSTIGFCGDFEMEPMPELKQKVIDLWCQGNSPAKIQQTLRLKELNFPDASCRNFHEEVTKGNFNIVI